MEVLNCCSGNEKAKETNGIAAINGRKALYRHLRSTQSSNIPKKPPKRMHTAKIRGADQAKP
jgi:hypothetical protein